MNQVYDVWKKLTSNYRQVQSKSVEKDTPCKINQKKEQVVMLISYKVEPSEQRLL